MKTNVVNSSILINRDSTNYDNDYLYERLKNSSFDASQQRKLNKTLQVDNELLTKNLQTLTEK